MSFLSHYTALEGLSGIAGSQSMRATDFVKLKDPAEVTYGLSAISKAGLKLCLDGVPQDLRNNTVNTDELLNSGPSSPKILRDEMSKSLASTSAFIISFARGLDDDEDERGIRSLWHIYTQNRGYCLQFDLGKIRNLVNYEREHFSYEWIELSPVKYGIDQTDADFIWLCEQFKLRIQKIAWENRRDNRLLPDVARLAPESTLHMRLLSYCCKHKDPSYRDEREVRIIACPSVTASSRPFVGIARRKNLYSTDGANSRRFISIAEHVRPGFVPRRIMIGSECERDERFVSELFLNSSPQIVRTPLSP
jgi:hypothetical protein